MKTIAAVVCALLATAGVALGHGTGGGGAVMSPVGMPVMTPIAFPVSRDFPSTTPDRRHKPPVTGYVPLGIWQPAICRPPQFLFTPWGVRQLSIAYPCGINDNFVESVTGPVPFWLPAPFMW